MVAATEQLTLNIDGTPDEGWAMVTVRANNKNLHWANICSELIDNSLEHSNGLCKVRFQWENQRSRKLFRVTDDGLGANDLNPFFKPGLGAPTGNSHGNSTFGTGLFACECCITNGTGLMTVATMQSTGPIAVAHRAIDDCQDTQQIYVERSEAAGYGLCDSGTSIKFTRRSCVLVQQIRSATICDAIYGG